MAKRTAQNYILKSQNYSHISQNNCLFFCLKFSAFTFAPQILLVCFLSSQQQCFVTAVLSLILLTSAHPCLFTPSEDTHAYIAFCLCVCVCVCPHMKTLAEATEIAVDCEEQDNSLCCCVGVTQLCLIIPTLRHSGKKGTERNH